ncbi:hypothetical protein GCM10023084_61620 [Streptomyces lacrimifluminis]|uniref:Uncharacterized protein n=1 Tax=Streptomyces lacrimifluminis TaxID=1500077 RepID=A0A917L4G2_9ACTN|nr:hypothetical protein [Streptomyces lacrimifluminis]GGJ44224.1 hypothetical protein GCM10012282_46460 [Streptomyces lacrimifluminis]
MTEYEEDRAGRLRQTGETAKSEATTTADQARQAAGQVTGTVAEQTRAVAGEARQQAGAAFGELRSRAVNEVEEQARRATGMLRQWSDDIGGLADNAPGDSPARSLASQMSDSGHRAADYLEKQGVDGALSDLRHFARRRPGAFLGGALVAGVVVGRLAKASGKAGQSSQPGRRGYGDTSQLGTGDGPVRSPLPAGSVQEVPPVPPVPTAAPGAEPFGAPQTPPSPVDPPAETPHRPYPEV